MATSTKKAPEVKGLIWKTCVIPGRLEGKLAIVTGANSGLGKYTTAELARRGARVIMACRNEERAEAAKKWILDRYGAENPKHLKYDLADPCLEASFKAITPEQLEFEQLDLASLKSVREFASRVTKKHSSLNYLVNNAGLVLQKYRKTEDGFEETMAVNYLGPYLLTELLLPLLRKGAPSRIVIISSSVHQMGQLYKPDLDIGEEKYDAMPVYNSSKLANIMHAKELAKRLEGTGITVVSLHPGFVQTELFRETADFKIGFYSTSSLFFAVTPWMGCQTTLYTLMAPNLTPGAYYSNCAESQPSGKALNESDGAWLWAKTRELLGLPQKMEING